MVDNFIEFKFASVIIDPEHRDHREIPTYRFYFVETKDECEIYSFGPEPQFILSPGIQLERVTDGECFIIEKADLINRQIWICPKRPGRGE